MSKNTVLTFKVDDVAIADYTAIAQTLKISRSAMIRNAIADFIAKQNPQAA